MPALQTVDLNQRQSQEITPLERTISSFNTRNKEHQESDALRQIYDEYQNDGKNLEKAMMDIQRNPNISPTSRVNTVNQLLQFQEHNNKLQKQAKEVADAAEKKASIQTIANDLQQKHNLNEEQALAYANNPSMYAKAFPKPSKQNQADRPIDPEQQSYIDAVINSPHWEKATFPQKQQLLSRGKVSTANQKAILDPIAEQEKINTDAKKSDRDFEYKIHKDSETFDEQIEKEAKAAKTQLDAIDDVEKAIKNVSPYSLANIFRNFGDVGKSISNALLTKDEAKIQASVPAFLEGRKDLFGVRLSDADLALLSDKLPEISKNEDANREILKLMKKYSKLALMKQQVAKKIKKENKGLRPLDYTERVNETFDEMKKPVKIINPENGKVIPIPAFELDDALQSGATLYNE